MGIIDVAAYDVIYPKLLPMLSYTDWLNMRLVNRKLNNIMKGYLPLNRVLYRPIKKENLFEFLTKDAVSLRVLVLEDVPWLTDDHVKHLLMRNKKLKRLELRNCLSLSQSILQVLTVQCVELEHLLLGGCGWVMPEALEYHVTHHSRLQAAIEDPKFKLDPMFLLGEVGLRSKPTERKKSRYAGLENLFHRITDPEEASRIDRKYHRKKLIRRPGSLLSFDVSRSHYLCDTILKIFFTQFNKIRYLNIANIPDLTDTSMKYVAENLVDLQYLDVSENPRISDAGVYTVAKYCLLLRTIKISGCLGVTQKLINYLKRYEISFDGENEPSIELNSPVLNLPFIPADVIEDLYAAAPLEPADNIQHVAIPQQLVIGVAEEQQGAGHPGYHQQQQQEGGFRNQIAVNSAVEQIVIPTNILDGDYHLKLHHKTVLAGCGHCQPNLNLQAGIEENRSLSNITSSELSTGLKDSNIADSSNRVDSKITDKIIASTSAVGCTSMGPSAAGCTSMGPSAAGCSSAGPSAAGCSSAGPSAAGCSSAGPSSAGCSSAGPSAAGCSSAGPSAAGCSSAGPSSAGCSSERTNAAVSSSAAGRCSTSQSAKERGCQQHSQLQLESHRSLQEKEWQQRSQIQSMSQRSQQGTEWQQRSQLHTQGQEMSWEDVLLTQATSPNARNLLSHEDLINSIATDDDDDDELMMMD